MKAIAFNIEDKVICCECILNTIKESEYGNLLLSHMSKTKLVKVDEHDLCQECNKEHAREENYKAAEELIKLRNPGQRQ